MNRLTSLFTFWVFRLMSVIGWVAIILGAFAAGYGTIPLLYLLLTKNAQPGDLLPDDRVLTEAEYIHEIEMQAALIAIGFLIKDSGHIFLFIKRKLRLTTTSHT